MMRVEDDSTSISTSLEESSMHEVSFIGEFDDHVTTGKRSVKLAKHS